MSETSQTSSYILVLEDDARTIQIVQAILSRHGYFVEVVVSSTEALVRMRRSHPEILIAAEKMLDGKFAGGWNFVDRLRRDSDLAPVPVIVLHTHPEEGFTPYRDDWAFLKGLPLGKPFNPLELLAFIRRIQSKGGIPKRILVVENDEAAIQLLQKTLCREGYQVEIAADTAEALIRLYSDQPSLLIIGDQTPGMTGAEFVTWLHQGPVLSELPAIILHTKYWTAEGRTWGNSVREGVHIEKPFNPQEVLAYVKRILA